MRIAIVYVTYDRVEDVKFNFELIRNLWQKHDFFESIKIFHVYNGQKKWYPQKTKEDVLIRTANPGHLEGALSMINTGVATVLQDTQTFDFILICSADTCLYKPEAIAHLLKTAKQNRQELITSYWFASNAFSSEFSIFTPNLAQKVFPLILDTSMRRKVHKSLIYSFSRLHDWPYPVVEMCLHDAVLQHISRSQILFIPSRAFVSIWNRNRDKKIGYDSRHDFQKKRRDILKELGVQKQSI